MSTAVKVIIYVVFMALAYASENDIPVMLYVKRAVFLIEWKTASYIQRKAINSYLSYVEEVECSHG